MIETDYGRVASVDLSEYMLYENGNNTQNCFTYTITSGNDNLGAVIVGDILTIPDTADIGEYILTINVEEKDPDISLMAVDYNSQEKTFEIKVSVNDTAPEIVIEDSIVKVTGSLKGQLIVAGYDEYGFIIKLEFIDGYGKDISDYENCAVIKVFLWKSGDFPIPLCESKMV